MFSLKLHPACAALLFLLAAGASFALERTFKEGDDLTDDINWKGKNGKNTVTILTGAKWSGDYTGGSGIDAITVQLLASASVQNWTFGEGNDEIHVLGTILEGEVPEGIFMGEGQDVIHGSGKIETEIFMGDGNDLIGSLDPTSSDNGLELGIVNLGDGNNIVRAASVESILGGEDDDTIVLTGDATGDIDLLGGSNKVIAEHAKGITGGEDDDTVILRGNADSVSLEGGTNKFEASSLLRGYSGGDGLDSIKLTGDAGSIHLGGGYSANVVNISGNISGSLTSGAAGPADVWDDISIGGGAGHVNLGNGSNKLTISKSWSGVYVGGTGVDIVTLNGKAKSEIPSNSVWVLGKKGDQKGDVIRGSGKILGGAINFGDGNDTIGDFSSEAPSSANQLVITSSLNLGGGSNKVWVKSLSSIKAGSGNDTVVLMPEQNLNLHSINLGEGENNLIISGSQGTPGSKKVILPLSRNGKTGSDILTLCNKITSSLNCGSVSEGFDSSFNVVLDARTGNIWDQINIKNQESKLQSLLSVMGKSISLNTLRLNNLRVAADGDVGSRMTINGKIDLKPFSYELSRGSLRSSGAFFELDFDSTIGKSDAVTFGKGSKNIAGGSSISVISVDLKLNGQTKDSGAAYVEIVKAHSDSALAEVDLIGGFGNRIFLNTREWILEETQEMGFTKYSLRSGSEIEFLRISEKDDTSWVQNLTDGPRLLRISKNWEANYTDGEGTDLIQVDSGVTVSGESLSLNVGGNNAIRGSGTISATVNFGSGDDTIGDFSPGGRSSDNEIKLEGHVNLGSGRNRVMAAQIKSVTGGLGNDTIISTGNASGLIDLGGGDADNMLIVAGLLSGNVRSTATNKGKDTVSIGGGTGNADLGDGENIFRVENAEWSGTYTDGPASDVIKVGNGATISSGSLTLEEGDNTIMGSGKISSNIYLGDGNDIIGNFSPDAPLSDNRLVLAGNLTNLGDGDNKVAAHKIEGYLFGSPQGNDTVILGNDASVVMLFNGANHIEAKNINIFTGGDGNDTVILRGKGKSIDLRKGENKFEASEVVNLYGGSGDDTVTVNGHGAYINLRGGSNKAEVFSAGSIYGGNGNDTVILKGNADLLILGKGKNSVTLKTGEWSGVYSGGQDEDMITVDSGAILSVSSFHFGTGENGIKGSGVVSTPVSFLHNDTTIIGNFASNAPFSDNRLDFRKPISLGEGTNKLKAATATSITGGSGKDLIVLRPESSFNLSTLNLGAGENKLWVLGSSTTADELATRKATISLSGGPAEGAETDSLYICSGAIILAGGCESVLGAEYAFNVTLDGSKGTTWESINIENESIQIQSLLSIQGSITLDDPKFNNIRIAGDGNVGDKITVKGVYEILPASNNGLFGTVFELDVDAKKDSKNYKSADILEFAPMSSKADGGKFSKAVVIAVKPVSRITAASPLPEDRIDLVTIANKNIDVVTLLNGKVTLNGHVWELDDRAAKLGGKIYFLKPTPVSPSNSIKQQPGLASQIAPLMLNGAKVAARNFQNHSGSFNQGRAGVLRNKIIFPRKKLWTQFTAGTETEAKGTPEEYRQSVQFLASGADLPVQGNVFGLVRHGIVVKHGSVRSDDSFVNSTITTFGYGADFQYTAEAGFSAYMSSSRIASTESTPGGEFDFRGVGLSAEARWETPLSKQTTLEYTGGISHSLFHNKALVDHGGLIKFSDLSGNFGIGFDHALDSRGVFEFTDAKSNSIYGGFSLTRNFKTNFSILGDIKPFQAENHRTWVNIDVGMIWEFKNTSLLAEFSRSTANGDGFTSEKRSFSFGYKLKW